MEKVKVLFVCLGNICRSPLAEGILRHKIQQRELSDLFHVDSCGTAAYHVGEHPDSRSVANARENGIIYDHYARQLSISDFHDFDYILPMDNSNERNIRSLEPDSARAQVIKMRHFDAHNQDANVPDPYYGGERGFQEVFDILERSMESFLTYMIEKHQLV